MQGLKTSGGSPQSTLGGIGNWSGRSSNGSNHNSPPATPLESADHNTLGLIYAAAGQVARLERNVDDPLQAALNGQRRVLAQPKPLQNPTAVLSADLVINNSLLNFGFIGFVSLDLRFGFFNITANEA